MGGFLNPLPLPTYILMSITSVMNGLISVAGILFTHKHKQILN